MALEVVEIRGHAVLGFEDGKEVRYEIDESGRHSGVKISPDSVHNKATDCG
jgi:hypothetical protein